jgi:hypothetical protein
MKPIVYFLISLFIVAAIIFGFVSIGGDMEPDYQPYTKTREQILKEIQ